MMGRCVSSMGGGETAWLELVRFVLEIVTSRGVCGLRCFLFVARMGVPSTVSQ